ncbi:MAG: EAL domain-containing protein [Gammaproteobacteria bacterium]|nr:EAL domain-containing protein [Gammaproteobacteria bacterium]
MLTCIATGYSSLGMLWNLQFHTLKIDSGFVRHKLKDKRAACITGTIIRAGQALGMGIAAEGVEKEPQLEFFAQ